MHTEELRIKYPAGFEQAVHLTKEEIEDEIKKDMEVTRKLT
ncbi:MAG: hypothetical protein AABZ13_04465 [Planctomycetota bacterium]